MAARALALCTWLARWASRVAGFIVLAAALVVAGDVLVRKLFDVTMGGSDELSGYALAIALSWGSASVLLNRSHIRIDVLYQYLPPKLKMLSNLIALIGLGSFVGLLVRYSWEVVFSSWEMNALSNTPLQTPLWIPQGLWFAGFCLFLFTLVILLWNSVDALVRGDTDRLQALLSPRSGVEEAEDEAAQAEALSAKGEPS
ncbi:TRAP transporter small permease subunit [Pokkaliibacter sp. CJK22405]|uniref:TRAP transporter small permease subunit n=1 Tax=Pokkaliibacter sp. CJK22405 TaxID=3384615 RepID=UPI003984AF68